MWPPKYIYLTAGDEEAKVTDHKDEITWCKDKITEQDIKYVRADKIDIKDI